MNVEYECIEVLFIFNEYKFNLMTGSSCSYIHNTRIFVLGTGFANHFLRASKMLLHTISPFHETVETGFSSTIIPLSLNTCGAQWVSVKVGAASYVN